MKSIIDVLIVARPDHSMLIYDALCKQGEVSFKFITFKVLPKWLRKAVRKYHVQYVTKNVYISLRTTLINVLKFTFCWNIAKNWSEVGALSSLFKKVTRRYQPKLIHYWSPYCNKTIDEYRDSHKDTIYLKDVFMPSFRSIYETIVPVVDKYSLHEIADYYFSRIADQEHEMKTVDTIVAPSQYVIDTYKKYYNIKKTYIVPYGIFKYPGYNPKERISENHHFTFVYVGRISIEKGADILFEFFSKHKEFDLHVYGNFSESQRQILEPLITNNIILHGSVSKSILQKEISKYDIGIHLSRFDAYSLGVGEIIGCGIPVIVSNTTGIEQEVKKYNLGLITDNTQEDIKYCVSILTKTNNYNKYISNVHNFLSHSRKCYGEEMVELYENLINDGKNCS